MEQQRLKKIVKKAIPKITWHCSGIRWPEDSRATASTPGDREGLTGAFEHRHDPRYAHSNDEADRRTVDKPRNGDKNNGNRSVPRRKGKQYNILTSTLPRRNRCDRHGEVAEWSKAAVC
jgi:hypothetical protein